MVFLEKIKKRMKVGPPGPSRKRAKLDQDGPIVIDSSDDEPDRDPECYSLSSEDEENYEIGPDGQIIWSDYYKMYESSDDDVEIIEEKSTPAVVHNEPGPSSRRESTDREVESHDEINWDRVRLPSSDDDDESLDPALVSRGPNPMIPGW